MTSSIPLAFQAVCVEGTMASSSPQFSLETQGKETIFSKSSGRKSLWKTLLTRIHTSHFIRPDFNQGMPIVGGISWKVKLTVPTVKPKGRV